jgi:hypothetical protein
VNQKDIFSAVLEIVTSSLKTEQVNMSLVFACFEALTYYAEDESATILLVNINKQVPYFESLLRGFSAYRDLIPGVTDMVDFDA